jgi:hypothetical protein
MGLTKRALVAELVGPGGARSEVRSPRWGGRRPWVILASASPSDPESCRAIHVKLRDVVFSVPAAVLVVYFGFDLVWRVMTAPRSPAAARPAPAAPTSAGPPVPALESRSVWPPAPEIPVGAAGPAMPSAEPLPRRDGPLEGIPGLRVPAMTDMLVRSGLECTDPAVLAHELRWTCAAATERGRYLVTIVGRRTDAIRTVSASVTGAGNDAVAGFFLGSVAYVACQTDSERGRQWVLSHITKGGATTVGPLRMNLSGGLGNRLLEIVLEPQGRT